MKSLLNCHVNNLHSVILGRNEHGNIVRMFIATEGHKLYDNSLLGIAFNRMQLAIHNHKTDITIYPITGEIHNISDAAELGEFDYIFPMKEYKYVSPICNEEGKFIKIKDKVNLYLTSTLIDKPLFIKHDELHTIAVTSKTASWIIVEGDAVDKSEDEFNSYSTQNLEEWSSDGMYLEMTSQTRQKLLDEFLISNIPSYKEI